MRPLYVYFLVAIAGALGVIVRYAFNFWHVELYGIIVSTLLVNGIGSYVIGLCWELWQQKRLSQETYIIVAGGFVGGLTTFSGYALNLALLTAFAKSDGKPHNRQNEIVSLVIYALLMPWLGMGLVTLGILTVR
jgi:CrcB protein